jgi:hypothetical protein
MQLPLAEKLTARLEDAIALTAKSVSPRVFAASTPNVMVWPALAMVKESTPTLSL